MRWIGKSGIALVLISFAPYVAHAQAAAASAGSATSPTGMSASVDKMKAEKGDKGDKSAPASVLAPAPATTNTSPHLVATDGPPPEDVNRKALEDRAGTDAGKLFLRSTPSGAQILIDGAFVGHTPLLLVVPPGKYRIEMRGTRGEAATSTIGLLANKTQEVALSLKQLYPATVTTK